MNDRITLAVSGHVADVRFNRPDRHNALDAAQFEAIRGITAELAERRDLRCVVLSGEGPSFCSGLDFPSFMQAGIDLEQSLEIPDGPPGNTFQAVAHAWRDLPMPVIMALHGVVFGGGLQIALGADIRICAPDARLSVFEINYGLIPDMAITQTLPPLVGLDVAKELSLTGRELCGEQARELGLVTHVAANPRDVALELAAEIAGRSPDAVRATKALFNRAWLTDSGLLSEESRMQKAIMRQPNFGEAVAAKMQKRPANFRDD